MAAKKSRQPKTRKVRVTQEHIEKAREALLTEQPRPRQRRPRQPTTEDRTQSQSANYMPKAVLLPQHLRTRPNEMGEVFEGWYYGIRRSNERINSEGFTVWDIGWRKLELVTASEEEKGDYVVV